MLDISNDQNNVFSFFFRENITENLGAFLQMISTTNIETSNTTEWNSHLKAEATRLNRKILTDDIFSFKSIGLNTILTQKSKKIVEEVSQRLADSLKLELTDSRRIIDNQRSRLKDLENEKEELLQTQHWLNEKSGDEVNECLVFLNTILSHKKLSININTVPISTSQRNIQIVKRLMANFNDNLTALYEKATNKSNEISDLHETITYLNEQLKSTTVRTECLEDEFHVSKKTSEQIKIDYRCSIDKLKTIQNKLCRVEEERNIYYDENMELKSRGIHGQYVNLNNQDERLLQRVKDVELDRDNLYDDLHEQIKKTNLCSSECKELEYKCEEFEHTISKLRREYIDMTREMNKVTHENEEIKKSVVDSERQHMVLKRDMKSLETSNKDLEDQLFHLTSENEKNKHDYEKITSNLQEYNTIVMELEEKLTICEKDILIIENDLKKERAEKADLEETNRHLRSQLVIKAELEGVLRDARCTMIQELEEKVITCERGMKFFENDLKKVTTEKINLVESNKYLRSQLNSKNELKPLAAEVERKEKKIKTELILNLDNDNKVSENVKDVKDVTSTQSTSITSVSNSIYIPYNSKSEMLKKENILKSLLENTKQKLEDVSEYLTQREQELKEGSKNVCKDTIFQQRFNTNIGEEDSTMEYANIKILQRENEYLQVNVNKVREELLNVQQEYMMEGNSEMNLLEFDHELQSSKCGSTLSYVKNEIKKINEDNERGRMQSPSKLKSVKMIKTNLEEIHLDSPVKIQRTEYVSDEVEPKLQEYKYNMIKELEDKLTNCERDKLIFESDLIKERNERVNLQQSYKSLKDGSSEKRKIILSGYEKLLTKLFHQRKEIISLLGLDKLSDISLEISSAQSMEYSLASEIDDHLSKRSLEVDSSFNTLNLYLQTSKRCWEGVEYCYRDLLHFVGPLRDKEICPIPDDHLIDPSLSFEMLQSKDIYENIENLVGKIKEIVKHTNTADDLLIGMKRKSKRSIIIIRKFKLREKHKKSAKYNKKYRMLLKKNVRAHRKAYNKKILNDFNSNPDNDITILPIHRCLPLEHQDINLNELSGTETEEIFEEALISIDRFSDEEVEEELINGSKDINLYASNPESEESGKLFVRQQDQRQYTVERLKFINKRFEVLLTCLKARGENKEDKYVTINCNSDCINALLEGVRKTFNPNEDILKRTIDILELAKDINITDLEELEEKKFIKDDDLKIIVLIRK